MHRASVRAVRRSVAAARHIHTTACLLSTPKPLPYAHFKPQPYRPLSELEHVVREFIPSRANYNQSIFGAEGEPAVNARANTELALALVKKQLKAQSKQGNNILLSPVTLASALAPTKGLSDLGLDASSAQRISGIDYAAVYEAITKDGDMTVNVTTADGQQATQSFAQSVAFQNSQRSALDEHILSHMVKQPYPLTPASIAAATPAAAAASTAPVTHSLNFTGFLAPKFATPRTRFPNYFYNFKGEKKIARMMVKAGKMWYVEGEKFQMVDLPYLNPNFVATLVLPRITAERTIVDHPDEFAYDQSPRSASTVHELLDYFLTPSKNGVNTLNHHIKYMQQMQGLVGLPGFQADYSVNEKEVSSSAKSANVHRAVLSISPHGLDEGVRIPHKHQEGAAEANFTALFDRPFLFFLRSANPANPQMLFAGVINDVFERNDFTTKYPLPEEWRNYKEEVANIIKQLYSKVL